MKKNEVKNNTTNLYSPDPVAFVSRSRFTAAEPLSVKLQADKLTRKLVVYRTTNLSIPGVTNYPVNNKVHDSARGSWTPPRSPISYKNFAEASRIVKIRRTSFNQQPVFFVFSELGYRTHRSVGRWHHLLCVFIFIYIFNDESFLRQLVPIFFSSDFALDFVLSVSSVSIWNYEASICV